MRVLAVDPGEKRIGLAISDPTGMISRPYSVIRHESREKDSEKILKIAQNESVEMIVVGWALNSEGEVGPQARKSKRFADVLRERIGLPVLMWDESGTTREAIQSRIDLGISRKKRRGHLDDLAASILLQDFLINNEIIVKDKEEPHGC